MEVLGIAVGISLALLAPSIPVVRKVTKTVIKSGFIASERAKGIASAAATSSTKLVWGVAGHSAEKEASATTVEARVIAQADAPPKAAAQVPESKPATSTGDVASGVSQAAMAPRPTVPLSEPALTAAATEAKMDDLTQIKGIGPKIADVLNSAGIQTIDQLADADVAQLQSILAAAGRGYTSRLVDPEAWVSEAQQLVAGD